MLCHTESLVVKMAEALWKDDRDLEEALKEYVGQGLTRQVTLDFVMCDFPDYT